MMGVQLSIIVPVYNIEEYLIQCIESIRIQTFSNIEIILVDDGSTDDSGVICDEFAKKDQRIKVLHKKNGGLVSARKAGLRVALGKYVGYVDGDDWIESTMYEKMCTEAEKEDADIVICDYYEVRNEQFIPRTQSMQMGEYSKSDLNNTLYNSVICKTQYFQFGFLPSLWNKIYRRDLLESKQFKVNEKIKIGEDAACSYPCLLEAERIIYLKYRYLYNYRIRDNSISHKVEKFYGEEVGLLIQGLSEDFKKYNSVELMNQLYMYGGYMIDNMITPNLTFKMNFNFFQNECKQIMKNSVTKKSIEYCNTIHTSSRMKRIINFLLGLKKRSLFELLLFRLYETRITIDKEKK